MLDAIVVGARCAGAPAAMLLAQRGHRVLLLDRSTFPSDLRQSTLLIHQPGVSYLEQWGLLGRIRASGAPPITQWLVDVGPLVFTGSPRPAGTITEAFAPRRTVLDKILLDGAVTAGVEVREGFVVDSLLNDGAQVIGIRGTDNAGRSTVDYARIVVGADGPNSLVARTVKAPEYNQRASKICTFYTYWSGLSLVEGIQLEFYPRSYRAAYAWPTNDGAVLVGANWKVSEFERVRTAPEAHYMSVLEECAPNLHRRLRDATRRDDFVGGYARNVFRKPFGDGWALVGDAGACYEFTSAHGMTNAFRQAADIADAIDQGLSGTRAMSEALADFERRRNEIEGAYYDFTYEQATLEPVAAEALQLFTAIHRDQNATNAFLGLFAQTTDPAEFFSPANLGKLTGQ